MDLVLWLLDGEMPTEVTSIGHSFTDMFKVNLIYLPYLMFFSYGNKMKMATS